MRRGGKSCVSVLTPAPLSQSSCGEHSAGAWPGQVFHHWRQHAYAIDGAAQRLHVKGRCKRKAPPKSPDHPLLEWPETLATENRRISTLMAAKMLRTVALTTTNTQQRRMIRICLSDSQGP
eukprot:UN3890